MRKSLHLVCASACLIPAACSTPHGGALGFVLLDPKKNVAAAEPLFGEGDERCLDDATFMLTTFAQDSPDRVQPKDPRNPDICTRIQWSLYWGLKSHGGTLANYNQTARNEVLGAMLAASDRKCGRYVAYLQQYNGNVKAGFGIINQVASALATVASGGLNRAFTTTAVIAGHTRSELEEAHFANQALGVLTHAFRVLRDTQRGQINTNLHSTVADYTVSQGLADVFNYHASCSIVVGLEEAQKAVTEKENKDDPTGKDSGVTNNATTSTTTTTTATEAGAAGTTTSTDTKKVTTKKK